MNDWQLLQRYVSEGSEAAFRELVHRHLNVVHSAVLRQVGGDSHLAQDVVQRVFVSLARKAHGLPEKTVLVGWLYRAAQLEAARAVRTEIRRREREMKAQVMNSNDSNDGVEVIPWAALSPLLDDAMAKLSDADREAVLLRYFSGKSFVEIGRAFTMTEDTARKRVDRAIEKLRQILLKRGLVSSTSALGLVITENASAAPTQAVLNALAANSWSSFTTGTAVKAGIFMGINKLMVSVTGASLFLAIGVLVSDELNQRSHARDEASLQQQLTEANQRHAALSRDAAAARKEIVERNGRRSSAVAQQVSASAPQTNFRSDPDYQRLTITSSLARRHLEFQRLYRLLGLAPAQIEEFENIMALQDQANIDAAALKEKGEDPQAVYKRSGPEWSSAMKRLLGDSGFAQLQDYLKTTSVRAFIDSLAGQTAYLGAPVSLDQADRLAEVALTNDSTYKSGKGTDPGMVNWDAVWPSAAQILSAEQLETFRTMVMTWQLQKEIVRKLAAKRNSPE